VFSALPQCADRHINWTFSVVETFTSTKSTHWQNSNELATRPKVHISSLKVNHLAKACFVQRLSNERIQTIVWSKGETALLSTCIDAALEEELTILSAREREGSQYRKVIETYLKDQPEYQYKQTVEVAAGNKC